MCDTQVLIAENGVWFAKNSDREPHEPQAVVRIESVRGDRSTCLRTTYLDVAQVPDRHAVILSKPCWIWGAEMGVNEHGLAIGNEALFTRQRNLKPALLGMDLLRLALERAVNANQAIDVISSLLAEYGQGGPAGYEDKSCCYDSSFIIADPAGAWVLETAGREWVARKVEHFEAISNAISTRTRFDRSSSNHGQSFDKNDSWLLPFFGASHQRRNLSRLCLSTSAEKRKPGFADIAAQLRTHANSNESPLRGSNKDICMHATGPIRRSQTTGSMICQLSDTGPRVLVTGTSAPCLSPFRPVSFEHQHAVLSESADSAPLWERWNSIIAQALYDDAYRSKLRARIAKSDQCLFDAWGRSSADVEALELQLRRLDAEIAGWPRQRLDRKLGRSGRIWQRYLRADT